MHQDKNFFRRAVDALIAGREQQARRIVARYERDLAAAERTFTKR
jgi:hypothetical protein